MPTALSRRSRDDGRIRHDVPEHWSRQPDGSALHRAESPEYSRCAQSLEARSEKCLCRRTAGCLSTLITARLSCAFWRISQMTRIMQAAFTSRGWTSTVSRPSQVFRVAARGRDAGDAAAREGSQLWHCLRHFGVFSGGGYRRDAGTEAKAYIQKLSRKLSRACGPTCNDIVDAGEDRTGFVTTMSGTKTQISAGAEEQQFQHPFRSASASRSTRPIQGTAADIIKVAMVHVDPGAFWQSRSCRRGWYCRSTTS